MRYLASCRGVNGTRKEHVFHETFKTKGDVLVWFHHKYREYCDMGFSRFEWTIFDYQDCDFYYDGISCLKDNPSFIDAIIDLEPMSRFIKVRND